MYTIHTIVHAFHTIIIRHIAQNSTHYCSKFLPFDEYIPCYPFVHIVQWYLTADFSTLIHLITPKITPKLVYFGSKSFVRLVVLRNYRYEITILLVYLRLILYRTKVKVAKM